MKWKRLLSAVLSAVVVMNTMAEPLTSMAMGTDTTKSETKAETGKEFDQQMDKLLKADNFYAAYEKVENRKDFVESLSDTEAYELKLYAKYGLVDEFSKLGEKPQKAEADKAIEYTKLYAEIPVKDLEDATDVEEKALKKLSEKEGKEFESYDSYHEYLQTVLPFDLNEFFHQLDSFTSVDTEALADTVIKFRNYVYATYGFGSQELNKSGEEKHQSKDKNDLTESSNKEKKKNTDTWNNGFFDQYLEMTEVEKEDLLNGLSDKDAYLLGMYSQYILADEIIALRNKKDLSMQDEIVSLLAHAEFTVEFSSVLKNINLNKNEKLSADKSLWEELSTKYNKVFRSYKEIQEYLQSSTKLDIEEIFQQMKSFSSVGINNTANVVEIFMDYLYQNLDIKSAEEDEMVKPEESKTKLRTAAPAAEPRAATIKVFGNSPILPEENYFSPRYLPGKTTRTRVAAPKDTYWVDDAKLATSYLFVSNTKNYWDITDSYKGKLWVRYNNVGTYEGQIVDMKITLMDFASPEGFQIGYNAIGIGNPSKNKGGTSKWMKWKVDYYKHGTNTLISELKGHQPITDIDYWSGRGGESFEAISNVSTTYYTNSKSNDYLKIKGNRIYATKAVGGDEVDDGIDALYCFNGPTHQFKWYGGYLRFDTTCVASEFLIKYMPNGGTGSMDPTRVKKGVQTATRKSTFKREHYKQNGWIVYRDYDDKWAHKDAANNIVWTSGKPDSKQVRLYRNGCEVANTAPCGIVYFYANWVEDPYVKLQYNVNGGTLGGKSGFKVDKDGYLCHSNGDRLETKVYLDQIVGSNGNGLNDVDNPNYINITKKGYHYVNTEEWKTNPGYKSPGKVYNDHEANYKGSDFGKGGQTVTLYANLTPDRHNVKFDTQGGNINKVEMDDYLIPDSGWYTLKSALRNDGYIHVNQMDRENKGTYVLHSTPSMTVGDSNNALYYLERFKDTQYYLIINCRSGKYIQLDGNEANVIAGNTGGKGTQPYQWNMVRKSNGEPEADFLWSFKKVGDNVSLINKGNGLAFDVPNAATANNTVIQMYPPNNSLAQQFKWVPHPTYINQNYHTKYKVTDSTFNVSWTVPHMENYKFDKWTTGKDGNGDWYYPGDNYIKDQNGGTVTLYAQWIPDSHNVAFDTQGGYIKPGIIRNGKYNIQVTADTGKYVHLIHNSWASGKVLNIWTGNNTQDNAIWYLERYQDTDYYFLMNADKTMYIKGGGEKNTNPTQQDRWIDQTDPDPYLWQIVKNGNSYRFINKSSGLALDITSAKYDNGTKLQEYPVNDNSQAQQFNLIPLDTEADYPTKVKAYSHPFYVSDSVPIKPGYKFLGWNTNPDGSGENYMPGAYYDHDQDGGTVTLYGQWEMTDYDIHYELNGGTNHPDNPEHYTYGQGVDEFKDATRVDHVFDGWFKDPEFKEPITSIGPDEFGDITIYAKWTPTKVVVVYDANTGMDSDGEKIVTENVPYDKSENYLVRKNASDIRFSKKQSTFEGWGTRKDSKFNTPGLMRDNKDYRVNLKEISQKQGEAAKNAKAGRSGFFSVGDNIATVGVTETGVPEVTFYATWDAVPVINGTDAVKEFYEGTTVTRADLLKGISATDPEKDPVDLTSQIKIKKIEYAAGRMVGGVAQKAYVEEWPNGMPADAKLDTWFMELDKEKSPAVHKVTFEVKDPAGHVVTATQTVKVKYNEFPTITAQDRYFTLDEAQNGVITKKLLLDDAIGSDDRTADVYANDAEEKQTVNNTAHISLVDFNADEFKNFTESGYRKLTFKVQDTYGPSGKGKEAYCQMTVYVIKDGEIPEVEKAKEVRFISEKYYNLNKDLNPDSMTDAQKEKANDNGGLNVDSKWYKDPAYKALIESTFGKTTGDHYQYELEDLDKMRDFVEEHGVGNAQEADGLSKFADQFMTGKYKK